MQRYYQTEPRFNGVYSRVNLTDKINNEAYVIHLDEYSDIGTHRSALYTINNNVTYFDSFGVEHIPKEIKIFIDKSIAVTNIVRIQVYDWVCFGFIGFMLEIKALTGFTDRFSPNNFKKDDYIILKYFLTNV